MRLPFPLILISFFLVIVAALAGQDKPPAPAVPTLTDAQRLEIVTLANAKHKLIEQQDAVQIDLSRRQLQAQAQYTDLQKAIDQAQAAIDSKIAAAGIDVNKFTIDPDTATVTAKPAPPADKEKQK